MILHETVSTLNNCEDFWFQYHLVSFCKQLLLMVKKYFAIGIDAFMDFNKKKADMLNMSFDIIR